VGKRVIVIVGPTCSGKSYLGLNVANLHNGEIISADSRQIYTRLNIGTAKPIEDELRKVKHHFINILNPDENYDASIFIFGLVAAIYALNELNKKATHNEPITLTRQIPI